MNTDPISDMLTRIKNGYMANRSDVSLPWSKSKQELARILVKNGYLDSMEKTENGGKNILDLKLKYINKLPSLTAVKRVSKPSLRVYVKNGEIKSVLGGQGIAIISTPSGLMTNKEARKHGYGGEVWCEIY